MNDPFKPIADLASALHDAEGLRAIASAMRKHYPRGSVAETIAAAANANPGSFTIALTDLEAADKSKATQLRREIADLRKELKRRNAGLTIVEGDATGDPLELPDDYPDLTMPDGYTVRTDGVYKDITAADGTPGLARVTYAPILITARYTDIDTHEEQCRLSWLRGSDWRSKIVPRATVASSRSLVDLAAVGAPVYDPTARATVSYLAAQEASNLGALPNGRTASHMGWVDSGRAFLAGNQTITTTEDDQPITFLGHGGNAQMADGYASAGSFQGWVEAIGLIHDKPLAYVALYASLSAPLLAVIESCPNFFVDWSARSGRGKTTSLRVGGSCWGSPADDGHLIRSWNSSATWIERAATVGTDLPLFLDETNKVPAERRRGLAQTVYVLANGVGKGRGTVDGTQRLTTWRTIVLSTGESRLTDYTQDEGTRGRVISLTGYPLGKHGAELAEELTAALRTHNGHAGPMMVRHLIERREQWGTIRSVYRAELERLSKTAPNVMARRVAAYVALLATAAKILHSPTGLAVPKPTVDPICYTWSCVCATTGEADRAADALRHLYEYASSRQTAFYGRHDKDQFGEPRAPHSGWLGAWDNGAGWVRIGLYRSTLEDILSKAGHVPGSILAEWASRGWLDALTNAAGRGMTKPQKVGDDRPRLICVTRAAFVVAEVIDV